MFRPTSFGPRKARKVHEHLCTKFFVPCKWFLKAENFSVLLCQRQKQRINGVAHDMEKSLAYEPLCSKKSSNRIMRCVKDPV